LLVVLLTAKAPVVDPNSIKKCALTILKSVGEVASRDCFVMPCSEQA